MEARTLEQRLKFDSGLTVGRHLVRLTHQGREVKALVEIGKRGAVSLLAEPKPGDMYSGWCRLRGDATKPEGAVIVWGARDPATRAMFDGDPVATVALT